MLRVPTQSNTEGQPSRTLIGQAAPIDRTAGEEVSRFGNGPRTEVCSPLAGHLRPQSKVVVRLIVIQD